MSVEMALDIHATSLNETGTIHVDVTATNNGSQAVTGMAAAFGFWLIDQNAHYVPGFTATGVEPTLARVVPPGESFGFGFDFTAPSVQVGPIYTLICYFQQTQDESTQTFTFDQIEQPLAPSANARSSQPVA
jgi:hypothetical protein